VQESPKAVDDCIKVVAMATARSLEFLPIKIFNETRCELGEGCGYDRGTNTVWWFDILARRLFEVQFGSDLVHSQRLPIMASAAAFIDNRRQLIAADDGIYVRNRSTGHLVRVKELEADIPGIDPMTEELTAAEPSGLGLWAVTPNAAREPSIIFMRVNYASFTAESPYPTPSAFLPTERPHTSLTQAKIY
jgi:hypothetical protein